MVLQQLRPKLVLFKTFEEAAIAVDEMFDTVKGDADESGDESGEEDDRRDLDLEDKDAAEDTVIVAASRLYTISNILSALK